MTRNQPSRLGDMLTYAFAVSLAVACLGFAGYKVFKLRTMENPPADLGLNFPTPRRRVITDDSIQVDPAATNSITRPAQDTVATRPLQPYTAEAPVESYRLLAVVDGLAFVEIRTFRGTEILALRRGMRLPGAGAIDRLERIAGSWRLIAGDTELTAEQR